MQQKWAKLERSVKTDDSGQFCHAECFYYGERCGLFEVTLAKDNEFAKGFALNVRCHACCRATGDI